MTPKASQGAPQDPKRLPKSIPKSAPGATKANKRIHTIPKLGFVDRRGVFEPPKLKVDCHYYVFGTLEVVILVKSVENIGPAVLLEPPRVEGGAKFFANRSCVKSQFSRLTGVRGKLGRLRASQDPPEEAE